MRNFKLVFSLLFGFLLLQSCKDETPKIIKTEPIAFQKEGELTLFKVESDSILGHLNIEIADNPYETETGLMYRKGMEEDQGMLFVFPAQAMHSFYMKNTEFPLDLLFIKNDMHVASIQENAKPFNETSLSSGVPVQYVLEVNAGMVEKWGLQVGDSISYEKQ